MLATDAPNLGVIQFLESIKKGEIRARVRPDYGPLDGDVTG